jgi:FKBP-type peptidyl-prolyl cis-trans isomerase FkpA
MPFSRVIIRAPWRLLLTVAALTVTIGCAQSSTAPSSYSPFTQEDLVVGTGDEAGIGKTVVVDYTGWLYDSATANQRGAQFDSSAGGTPFTVTLGSNQVIQGWERGVPGMKVGGTRRLVIPPSLAYGDTRRGGIPPNATLLFEITLLEVQ